jgi:predicted O-methyltransferase YrrM/prolipoprotein diacylglyceryltransferase
MLSKQDSEVLVSGIVAGAAILVAGSVFHVDLRRRKIRANAYMIAAIAGAAGLAVGHFTSHIGLLWAGGMCGGFLAFMLLGRSKEIPLLEFLDAISPAAAVGFATAELGAFFSATSGLASSADIPLRHLYGFFSWLAIAGILWRMSTKATLGPRPKGEIIASYLMLAGAAIFLGDALRPNPPSIFGISNSRIASLVFFFLGALWLWPVLSRYHKVAREHRILQHVAERGDVLQQEYSRATPECPHPERWRMYDAMAAEVEVLDFLKTLVSTIKPELVVETGTFLGSSTLRIAEGLKENGFGRVITCEADPKVFEEAKKRFLASGLADWIQLRNESSLEMKIEGRIDLLYCDSDLPLREQEVRRFLPQMNPNGLILMHDASSALKTVRGGAKNLEREGLLSVVFLPTPRGLVVAQKREGRT